MKTHTMPEISSTIIDEDPRPKGDEGPRSENGIGHDEYDSVDGKGGVKDDKVPKLKKHPGAPKRFRTAFIIFSQHRHGEMRAKLQDEGAVIDTINVARMVSDQWRELTADEKEKWEEMAREDKARYIRQKDEYAGPWKVPADMKKPKDPTAPKKPTPAYFSFSNERRQSVKKDNPTASNGEISKILSKMWKEVDEGTRATYIEKEKSEREEYNKLVDKWKKERKESGRDNWWEIEQSLENGGRKRPKVDLLANSTGTNSDMEQSAANRRNQVTGGISSFPSSLQDQLSVLSNQQGNGSFLASLLPGLSAQGAFGNNAFGGNMQVLNQQHLGNGGGLSLGGFFGASPSGGGFQNTGMQMGQSTLLASLFGGNGVQQQQQQPSNTHGMNDFLLTSLLSGGVQPQPQNLQSLQSSCSNKDSRGNASLQQQNDQGISHSALASFLSQQQSMPPTNQSQPDQLAILQNFLQQQGGGNSNAGSFQHPQQSYQQQSTNSNITALEEALARLVTGNSGGNNGSYP